MSGIYIVIEGNDGAGKSTQAELLASYYRQQGREAIIIEEPGSDDSDKTTPVANYLRSLIKDGSLARDPEINLALFSAARRELWQKKIEPALECGAVVISARNYVSTLSYQGYGEGVNTDHIMAITKLFTDERYMKPDFIIILTLDNENERKKRIAKRSQSIDTSDTFESRSSNFQKRVDAAYRTIASKLPSSHVIECYSNGHYKTAEQINAEIQSIVQQ
jgi:dTMP kinase